jgi:hypothetical protein
VPEAWEAYADADIDMFIYGLDEQTAKAKIEVVVISAIVKLTTNLSVERATAHTQPAWHPHTVGKCIGISSCAL